MKRTGFTDQDRKMAEDKPTSPGKLLVKVDSAKISDEQTILISDASNLLFKEGKEEETTPDGKHGKVEKEVIDLKQTSRDANPESSRSVANATLLEMEKKLKELEVQLENTAKELKHSESDKVSLKSEVDLAREKLGKMSEKFEEVECDRKMLKDQISESEKNYDSQLKSLQEALAAKDSMEKEFVDVKIAFTALSDELENSRKKTKDLEQELMIAVTEVHKLDELNRHGVPKAETESKRALELEKMLSFLQEQLQLSESRADELEQKLMSYDAVINELTKELNLNKFSQEQMKADVLASKNILSATEEDLQTKLMNLKDAEMKLQEQVKERKAIETQLRNQELQLSNLQDDLYNLNGEKVRLQTTVADLDTRLQENEEIRSKLEAELNINEEKVNKTATLLSDALSYNDDLEKKLKLMEELHYGSRAVEEGLREQLNETQMKLEAAQKNNMEIEGELNFAETKFLVAEEQIEELKEQITELTAVLREVYEGTTIVQLESSLSQSFSRNTQLEKEVNSLVHKCAEQERFATATHQRGLELENLIRSTNSRAEGSEKRVTELEKLLDAARIRSLELERLLSASEARHRDAESESKQHRSRASDLLAELEAYQTRAESLEAVLQASDEREKELTDSLKVLNEERKKFEQLSNIYGKKLSEAEKTVQYLQSDLRSLIKQGENIEEDLQASRLREKVLLDKLKYAGEQLERRDRTAEEVTATNLELKSQNEHLLTELELKLQEATLSFRRKETESKELRESLKSVEEETAFYKAQAVEATENVAILKHEVEANARKVISLVDTVEELQQKISESDAKLEQTFSENDMLATTYTKLREESGVTKSVLVEKEAAADFCEKTLPLETQLKVHEAQATSQKVELEEAFLKLQSSEALAEQLQCECEQYKAENGSLSRENVEMSKELSVYEEWACDSGALAENHKGKLEDALLKLQELETVVEQLKSKSEKYRTDAEGLTKENSDLSRELATYEAHAHESAAIIANQREKLEDALSRLQDLEGLVDEWQKKSEQLKTENQDLDREHMSLHQDLVAFNTVAAEKEDKSTQLHSLRNEMNYLMQQLTSDNKILQSQITTVIEDNNMLNEMCQKARNELEATLVHLEEKLSEGKEKEISLTLTTYTSTLQTELPENPFMQARISELEQKLLQAEKTYVEEDLEQKKSMKQSLGELEAERQHVMILERQIEELEQKLQETKIQYKEKTTDECAKHLHLYEELNELPQKLSETVEMEKNITELEIKLQQARRTEHDYDLIQAETEDSMVLKSREFRTDASVLANIRNKNDGLHHAPEVTSAHPTTHVDLDPSGAMALRFILGVALMSIIIGIILGKRF